MKKAIFTFLLSLSFLPLFGQSAANKIVAAQATPKDTTMNNFVFVALSDNRLWVAKMDCVRVKKWQMKWMPAWTDSMVMVRMNTYVPLWTNVSGRPTNVSSFTNDAGYATAGSSTAFTNKTGNISQWTNNSGYITSVSSGNVTSALGFTPANPNGTNLQYMAGDGSKITFPSIPTNTSQLTNGAGFITSYSETDPLFDTKFSAKNTGGLAEGSNLYYTAARFNTAFSAKTTTDLTEGTRLYYTDARAQAAFTAGTGINITSGVISASTAAATFNNAPGRTIGTSFQVSTTRPARVSYTVSCATALSLLNLNGSAQCFLEISSNNSTWVTVNGAGSTKTLGVAITLSLGETILYNVQCEVPAGYWVRLRGVTSGTGSAVAFSSGQEITY